MRTISEYYLGIGGLSEVLVLAEAKKGKDDKARRKRLCEAYFYLGAKRLVSGNRNGAIEYFSKSIATDVRNFIEYDESKAILTQMNAGKI